MTDNHRELVPIETANKINELFYEIFSLFPSQYCVVTDISSVTGMKICWTKAFMSHGIIDALGKLDIDLFNSGIRKMQILDQAFAPSCGQFINLCLNN